jgi:hypothetical protein
MRFEGNKRTISPLFRAKISALVSRSGLKDRLTQETVQLTDAGSRSDFGIDVSDSAITKRLNLERREGKIDSTNVAKLPLDLTRRGIC